MKYAKKTVALLLALAMLFSMAPASFTASAEETTPKLTFTEPTAEETTPEETTPVETTPKLSFSETLPAEEPTVESPVEDIVVEKNPGKDTETESLLLPQTSTIGDREQSGFCVNPLYEGLVTEDSFPKADFSRFDGEMGVQSDYVNASAAAAQMRQFMKNRVSYYTLYVQTTNSDRWAVFEDIMAEALAHNGVPTEGDSLMWQYGGYNGDSNRYSSGSTYYVTYNIYMPYYTTADQEAALNTAVSNLLAQLNLWNKTDYEKVCGVYDYICDNVTYDYAHLNDPNYDLMFTAYAALVNKTAVCQGYSVLFYRLMLELGVDARVIVGDGGGPHAWNIVELDNLYYNLDSTWDAGQYSYNYFLVSPANFTDHIREPEYDTAEFHAAYPMSPVNYGVNFDPDFIDLYANTLTNVSIYTAGSSVYYRFIPATSGYYALTADSSSDTVCNLYNSSWVMLAGDDDSGEGSNFLVEYWLEAGQTYYYEIFYYGNTTGSFYILLEETDGSSDSDEIIPLTLDQLTDVTISYGDERVFYSFTPAYDGYYAITSYSNLDTYCFVYDSNGDYKSGADDSGIGANFYKSEYIYAGETYYFEVCLYSESETGSFQICISEAGPTATGKMDNYAGNYYAVSDLVLGSNGTYRTPGGAAVYIAVNNLEEGGLFWLNNYTLYDFVSEYGSNYFDLTYWNNLTNLMDADGYVTLTPDTLNYLIRLITGNSSWGETSDYVRCYLFYDVSGSGEDDEVTVTPLTLNEPTDVTITVSGSSQYYSFTPAESGNYILRSLSPNDTLCYLYDSSWNTLAFNDDDGKTLNFCLEYWLEASKTYYYKVGYNTIGLTGTFQILLTSAEEEFPAIPLTLDVYTDVTIPYGGAQAYYTFTPDTAGYYALTSFADSDTYCRLYNADWNELTYDDDSGDGLNFLVEYWLEAGVTYYYEVRYLASDITGTFQILLTYNSEDDTVYPLELDVPTTVTVPQANDTAYYSFTPTQEGYYTLTASANGYYTWCEVYEVNGEAWSLLGGDEGYDFSCMVYLEANHVYYFLVGCGECPDNSTFRILLSYTPDAWMNTLVLNETATVLITSPGTAAYYSFTPVISDYYCLTATSDGSDTYCQLYDADWNYIISDDDRGDGADFSLNTYLEAGKTYYFEVFYYSESETGSFRILLTQTGCPSPSGKFENYIYANYQISDLVLGSDGVYRTPEGGTVYIAVNNEGDKGLYYLLGNTLASYVAYYDATMFDLTYWGALWSLTDSQGYAVLTETTLQYLTTLITGNPEWGDTVDDVFKYLYYDPAGSHIHVYTESVVAPTCTEEGYTVYTCECGDSYVSDYVGALGHDYGEWYVTKDATCTEQGEERHDCSRCAHHETRQTAANGHSLVHHEGQAATCVEHGWEAYDACENCDYTTYVEIPATGHNYTYKMTQEPTLDSTGVLTGTCVNCSGTTTVSMPALNLEDYTREILKVPTTESEGTAKYTWKNTEYGVFSVNVTLPMLTDQLMGDVNNDGEVDIFDANLIVAYYNGTANLTDNQLIAADVNGDGEVDIFDANLVVGYYNGTVDKFPAEI